MNPGRLIGALFGIILAGTAVALLVGGIALVIIFGPARDEDGFVYSPSYQLNSDGYAVISERVDLAPYPGDWLPANVATARLEVGSDGQEIFIAIGPSADVAAYLNGVAYDRVDRLGWHIDDVRYDSFAGAAPSNIPRDQSFWVASSSSTSQQTLDWEVERGDWTIVVMNADGSADVSVSAKFGVSIPVLLWVGLGMIIGGLVFGAIGTVMLVAAFRRTRAPAVARV